MNDRRKSIPPKPNAFREGFLARLGERDEPPAAGEAEHAGPWQVRDVPGGYGVFREWEPAGAEPTARFEHREHALMLVAVLPAVGREPLFHLDPKKRMNGGGEGYVVETVWGESWSRAVGRLPHYEPEVIGALHLAEAVLRSPSALAHLLEAAGPVALRLAGEILAGRLGASAGVGNG